MVHCSALTQCFGELVGCRCIRRWAGGLLGEKIILTINKLNKKYNNIKLDIMGIEKHHKLLDVFIHIRISFVVCDTIVIENITVSEYDLEWKLEYRIRKKIKNMLSDFYRIEL